MLYVSIFVELLRSRPALAVWIAALVQAALWAFVPALFYWAPPGDVAAVVTVGHEFQLGTYLGPPLAFWIAEIAFHLAGNSMVGVYVLSLIIDGLAPTFGRPATTTGWATADRGGRSPVDSWPS
jgi:hypothetical protein